MSLKLRNTVLMIALLGWLHLVSVCLLMSMRSLPQTCIRPLWNLPKPAKRMLKQSRNSRVRGGSENLGRQIVDAAKVEKAIPLLNDEEFSRLASQCRQVEGALFPRVS